MQIKKSLIAIFGISFCLTTIGLLADTDAPNPEIWTNVFEFFMMQLLITTIISVAYFASAFAFKNAKQLFS